MLGIIRNRNGDLFSVIAQPWRHLGAILWKHIIDHNLVTICHFKFTVGQMTVNIKIVILGSCKSDVWVNRHMFQTFDAFHTKMQNEFLRVFSIQKSKHRFWIWFRNLITFQSLLTNLYQLITFKHYCNMRIVIHKRYAKWKCACICFELSQ